MSGPLPSYAQQMKVFLSWSKDLSRDVAQYFVEWLPGVIQECSSPFISSDIDKGEPWFETITTSLGSTDIGIVFITPENHGAVWLNFEAGAMLNKFGKSGICPVLVGLKKGDYDGPLKNLQLTELTDETDVKQLLGTINKKCITPLDQAILDKMLSVFWPDLQTKISELIDQHAKSGHPTNAKRNMDDKVDELLSLVRGLAAKGSTAEQSLVESRAMMEELLTMEVHRPSKKYVPKEGKFDLRDAVISNRDFDRIPIQEGTRSERLERFAQKHGSTDIILNGSNETVVLVDVVETGNGNTELLIKGKEHEAVRIIPLKGVTVIPF